jgi:hypothetical protein
MAFITYTGLIPTCPPLAKAGRGQRLCREILREGKWLVGSDPSCETDYLDATPMFLDRLCKITQERAASGMLVPLQWDHNPENGLHTDDSTKVEDYFEEFWCESHDGVMSLWAACYPGSKYAELSEVKNPVSPHIQSRVVDGTGKVWPVALLHVALVDHATIPGQNGFVAMALTSGTPIVDIAQVIQMLNQVLNIVKPGLSIPDTVADPAQLETLLSTILSMLGADAEEEATEDPAVMTDTGNADMAMPDAVAMSLKSLKADLARLTAEVTVLRGQKEQSAKDAFSAAVDGAIAMGLPAASRDALLKVGHATDWDIAQLDAFKSMGTVALGLKSTKIVEQGTPDEEYAILAEAGLSPEAIARQKARLS